MTTYAEAITPKTKAEIRDQALALLTARGAPVAGWSDSAPQRIAVDDFAERLAEETVIRALLAKCISPQEAAAAGRDWVGALIGWFGETYIPAIAAVWTVPLAVLASEAPLAIGASTVVQIQADGGAIFELIPGADVLLSSASTPTAYQGSALFRARVAGTAGNVSGASITKIITGPAGLSIATTPTLYTAGRDEETPEAAIVRCLGKWGTLGAGWTLASFDYWIPNAAPTVTRWRVDDANPFGPGTIGATLANAAGGATTPEVNAVIAKLNDRAVRSLGSGGLTIAAAGEDTLALTVTVEGDGTNASLADDIEAAVAALGAAFPIGAATLDINVLRAVILGAAFTSIPVDIGSTTETITPNLPGFSGAVSITSLSISASHSVPADDVLVLSATATVT